MERKKKWILQGVLLICLGLSMLSACKPTQGRPDVTPPQIPTFTPKRDPVETPPDYMAQARELLSQMTLSEKVGQMFFVRCPESKASEQVTKYTPGGYILFARDFEPNTVETMQKTIQSYQDASKLPLFIGVDEEGGRVTRISCFPQYRSAPFMTPQELYKKGGWDAVTSDTTEKAALLKHLGINMNFAPVCDVSTDPADYINHRTFGKNAKETAKYVEKVVQGMAEWKLGSVLKHFPGYGNNEDTHTDMVRDDRPYAHFTENDFLPFAAGIENGANVVMVSHNIVTCMDPDMPASLSAEVHRILREELKFDGIIITDDLYMDAIRKFTGNEEAAVAAVLAGNDMLCCTDFTVQIPAVIQAVADGKITEERIDDSVLRILYCKLQLGIL